MKSDRRKSRELALQAAYAEHFRDAPDATNQSEQGKLQSGVLGDRQVKKSVAEYADRLIDAVSKNMSDFDRLIEKEAVNWDADRLTIIDRIIIRIALAEILLIEDVPPGVAINEAIEIARDFSTDKSTAFINGVLDSIYKRWLKEGKVESSTRPA